MSAASKAQDLTKRTLDVLGSAFGLVLLSPVMCVVALLVSVRMGRPVLFRQQRPGRGGRLFDLVKFRSMRTASPEKSSTAFDVERLTRFGNFLRATSLDELPTLWNVLRGDMSLVGPRPLLAEYLTRYTARQARRHEVRPGVTGWAQTNGRNTVHWEERFEMDVWYVDNRSLWLDAQILLRTVKKVFRSEGVMPPGLAPVVEFTGMESLSDIGNVSMPATQVAASSVPITSDSGDSLSSDSVTAPAVGPHRQKLPSSSS